MRGRQEGGNDCKGLKVSGEHSVKRLSQGRSCRGVRGPGPTVRGQMQLHPPERPSQGHVHTRTHTHVLANTPLWLATPSRPSSGPPGTFFMRPWLSCIPMPRCHRQSGRFGGQEAAGSQGPRQCTAQGRHQAHDSQAQGLGLDRKRAVRKPNRETARSHRSLDVNLGWSAESRIPGWRCGGTDGWGAVGGLQRPSESQTLGGGKRGGQRH